LAVVVRSIALAMMTYTGVARASAGRKATCCHHGAILLCSGLLGGGRSGQRPGRTEDGIELWLVGTLLEALDSDRLWP
jgi:hypothetical protein